MITADLRVIRDSLNDELGTGGQSKLAHSLGWHHSTVWRKLNGNSAITQSDVLAIQKATEMAEGQPRRFEPNMRAPYSGTVGFGSDGSAFCVTMLSPI